jgi:hypothetical protein
LASPPEQATTTTQSVATATLLPVIEPKNPPASPAQITIPTAPAPQAVASPSPQANTTFEITPTPEPAAPAKAAAAPDPPIEPTPRNASPSTSTTRVPRKPSAETTKPTPTKPLYEAPSTVPSPTPPQPIPVLAPQSASMQAAPTMQAVAPTIAAAPQPTAQKTTETTAAPIAEAQTPALPTLPHTTLQASPTTLEVGVPSGTHGWLKIRAEIDSTGTVQASLSPANHAAHETLRRDLPALTTFLANEQVAVQLHVAEPPQTTPASHDQDLTPGTSTPDQGNGNPHPNPDSPPTAESPEKTDWSTPIYEPQSLHGGSWVNVVA